ncbi:MAG: alpha/beta hydrolase [Pseudomonadota bacterium]|nr:alpha/beta hydrolase [Pseudomonadota bacterium]
MNTSPAACDGTVRVPGGELRYRLTGTPSSLPTLVFENGWGASFEQWAWVEAELASTTRLLLYDRAGIGGSTSAEPQTASALTTQLLALLAALRIEKPIVVGHSYGGLMCALHAAQAPAALHAIVQVDNTPECADPLIDRQLGAVGAIAHLSILCARLGIRNPLFAPAAKLLPAAAGSAMMAHSFASASSLRAALHELRIISSIRASIAKGERPVPRLVISAAAPSIERSGVISRLLASPEKARAVQERMHQLHRLQAAAPGGRCEELPYTHGDLVFTQAGAKATAARIRELVVGTQSRTG